MRVYHPVLHKRGCSAVQCIFYPQTTDDGNIPGVKNKCYIGKGQGVGMRGRKNMLDADKNQPHTLSHSILTTAQRLADR